MSVQGEIFTKQYKQAEEENNHLNLTMTLLCSNPHFTNWETQLRENKYCPGSLIWTDLCPPLPQIHMLKL